MPGSLRYGSESEFSKIILAESFLLKRPLAGQELLAMCKRNRIVKHSA